MRQSLLFSCLFAAAATSLPAYELPDLPPIPAIPPAQPVGSVAMGDPASFPEVQMDFPIESGPFAPTWPSILANYPTRDSAWLRQAKFGIWVHFGPQAAGQSGDWFARRMYIEGEAAYNNHIRDYGHPSTAGYKDLIRTWNPTALDPAALTQIYHDAGARFLMIQGVHHDQYDNWNSKYQPWNSMNLGPHRDILGEWKTALRAANMHFGVTFHHEYSWWWWQSCYRADTTNNQGQLGVPYDGNLTTNYNGTGQWWGTAPLDLRKLYLTNLREYAGIYNAMDQSGWNLPQGIFTNHLDYAHWYATWWALRIQDVIENYDPDFIYTDGNSTQPFSGYMSGSGYKCDAMQRVLAHYFNRTLARRGTLDTFGIVKFNPYNRGVVNTFEAGYPSAIKTDQPWIGEVPVGDWFYNTGFNYNPNMVIRYLLECVSRDGAAAINIALRPDGSLDPGSVTQLQAVGNWMNINSAGIYGSRAWLKYGEGTNALPGGALGNAQANKTFTNSDFRYTVGADGCLYAYCMTVPAAGATLTLPSLGTGDGTLAAPITSVELLGNALPLTWNQTATDLNITCPASMPFQTSVCFKIGPSAIIATTTPAHLTATESASTITLNWETPETGVTFAVKRSISAGGPYSEIATGLTSPTFVDSTASANTPYYYVVTATKNGNTSPNSEYAVGLLPIASAWQTRDIGTVGAVGGHSVSAGYHAVKGAGADIWNTNDQFRYVYKRLAGNGTITAKVVSLQNTGGWAKAGVMIRETLDANSKYAIAYVSPSNGTAFQQRATTGGSAAGISNTTGINAPYWVKLSRVGSSITAYQSADGAAWNTMGSTTVSMTNDVYVGLAVCSVSSGTLNQVVFSNVAISAVAASGGVTWQAPATVTADTDISLNGLLVHAGNFRSSGNATVTVGGNSIAFVNRTASNAFSGLATGEEAKVVFGAGGKQTNTSLFNAAGTTVSTAFESVLDGSAWENTDAGPAPGATDMVLRVTGAGGAPLTAGTIYQIQLFCSDDRATSSTRSQLYHDGLGHSSDSFLANASTSVIGTFTANSTGYQDFYARNTSGGTNFPVGINAYVLRMIGPSDSDADSLPDAWESTWFGNLSQTASADPDGDGTDNQTEQRLGLDPNDPVERFHAMLQSGGVLQWPSSASVLFTIQASTDLSTWSDEAIVSGNAGNGTYIVSPPVSGTRFYRVRLDP